MCILSRFKGYYRLFGLSGLFLAMKAKLKADQPTEFTVSAPGIKKPFSLRLSTSDIAVYRQVFLNSAYRLELSKHPKTIIDAGANIGLASIYFCNRYPEARIFAIEPERTNFALLKKNATPYPNIIPIRAALWEKNIAVDLIDPRRGHWGFQVMDSGNKTFNINDKVQGVTVERIILDYSLEYIDILKIDIEGAEKEVFENSSQWIDKVGVIIVELHDWLKVGCSRSFYNATNSYSAEWHRGQNVFLARKEYV